MDPLSRMALMDDRGSILPGWTLPRHRQTSLFHGGRRLHSSDWTREVPMMHHVAQLNVGHAVAPLDTPQLADFMAWLDGINALAEQSHGFVWRLQGENGNNTGLKVDDNPLFIVNMSLWESIEDLHAFTYRSVHKTVFARRYDWFERAGGPNLVMWWVPAGTIPSVDTALVRLRRLAELGPTPEAFTFKTPFPPPDALTPPVAEATA